MTASIPRSTPFLIGALSTIGPLGIDMYLPSIPAMATSLNSSEGTIQLSLMTYFLGLILGQLFYGPLSDKFDRKPLIVSGLIIFTHFLQSILLSITPLQHLLGHSNDEDD